MSMTQVISALRDFWWLKKENSQLIIATLKMFHDICTIYIIVNEGFEFMPILNLEGNPFHAEIVIGLGPDFWLNTFKWMNKVVKK